MEAFKTFDREGQGFISAAEMRHVLTGYGQFNVIDIYIYCICLITGERLEDPEVDAILKFIDLREDLDGNIKYEGQCLKLYSLVWFILSTLPKKLGL